MTFSLYGSTAPSSSNVTNLINYALSFDSFRGSDFVVFNDAAYSYYIVWSPELQKSGDTVICDSEVYYIHYYRDGDSYSSSYFYESGTFDTFHLNLSPQYITTSSVPEVGFATDIVNQYRYYDSGTFFFIILVALVFAIFVTRKTTYL